MTLNVARTGLSFRPSGPKAPFPGHLTVVNLCFLPLSGSLIFLLPLCALPFRVSVDCLGANANSRPRPSLSLNPTWAAHAAKMSLDGVPVAAQEQHEEKKTTTTTTKGAHDDDGSTRARREPARLQFQRRNLKTFESYFVPLVITLVSSTHAPGAESESEKDGPPPLPSLDEQQIHAAVQASLLRLHGLVGSSFNFDIVALTRGVQAMEALLRVSASELQLLLTAISAGIDLPKPASSNGGGALAWRCHAKAARSAFSLETASPSPSLADLNGSGLAWLRSMEEQHSAQLGGS
ncbi:unnamed protein product [Parajaminaea phylloscopi]